jgi:hypothetical protein
MKKTLILAMMLLVSSTVAQGQAVRQGEAVDGLLYLFNTQARGTANYLVASAAADSATGEACRLVVRELLARSKAAQVAETRSRLTEADRAILQAAKVNAVFDPAKVFPERIAEPTRELKLDAMSEVSKE